MGARLPPPRTWRRANNNRAFHRNLRDMMGDVIDPNDHFVLPSGYRFSRHDVGMMLQQQRFVQAPYDPFTNVPFPANQVNGILQGMVDFVASAPPNMAVRRQRPGGLNLQPNQLLPPHAQRARPNPPPPPPPVVIPAYGMDNQTPPSTTPPYERMLNLSMRLGLTKIAQKLLLMQHRMPDGAQMNNLTAQEVATAAGLTPDELVQLNEDTTGVVPPTRDNVSITSSGVAVKHNHGKDFRVRTVQRPNFIRTNAGTTAVTRL